MGYSKKLKIVLLVLISFPLLFNLISAKTVNSQIYTCENATILVKPSASQAGSTEIIIKPANAKNVVVDIKFQDSPFSLPSTCFGYARILYKWSNTYDAIPINKPSTLTPLKNITKEGRYEMVLQISSDKDYKLIYLEKMVTAVVAKDILNPPGGGTNNNTNTATNTNTNTSGPPNSAINTSIGGKFELGLDEKIGDFFNPLEKNTLPELLATLLRILFMLIGMVAVVIIIISGFRMVMASGNETELTKAKQAITWAVVGLIVALMSFSIVAIVQRLIQG